MKKFFLFCTTALLISCGGGEDEIVAPDTATEPQKTSYIWKDRVYMCDNTRYSYKLDKATMRLVFDSDTSCTMIDTAFCTVVTLHGTYPNHWYDTTYVRRRDTLHTRCVINFPTIKLDSVFRFDPRENKVLHNFVTTFSVDSTKIEWDYNTTMKLQK